MSEIDRCFEILGLQPGASKQQIKAAYRRLAKRWHPDQFGQDHPQRQQAEETLKRINDAYQTLKDIPEYQPAKPAPPRASAVDFKTRPSSPQDFCAEANALMQEGQYEEAAELLSVVIKRHPTYAEAYRYRGLIYSLLGYELRAEADLRKAKSLGLRKSSPSGRKSPNPSPRKPAATQSRPAASSSAARQRPPKPEEPSQTKPFALEMEGQLFAESSAALGAIALSPHLKLLAAGGDNGTIYLWNFKTRQAFHALEGHAGAVRALLFNEDGQFLFSSSADGTIKLWHLASGSLVRTLSGHAGGVASLAISWPHKVLVSAGDDGTVGVWDLKSNQLLRKVLDQTVPVGAVALNRTGELALCGSADGSIKLCHVLRGGILQWSEQHSAAVSAIATSPTGKYFASASEDGQVALWDGAGDYVRSFQSPSASGAALLLAHQDTVAIGGGSDGYLRAWNTATGQLLQSQAAHHGSIRGICAVPTAATCLSLGSDRVIKQWQLRQVPQLQ
jgi:COMPASS component SWD3